MRGTISYLLGILCAWIIMIIPMLTFMPESFATPDCKGDCTPPQIFAEINMAPDSNGWYTKPFIITFTGQDEDGGSGFDRCSSKTARYASGDDDSVSISVTCYDKKGNKDAKDFKWIKNVTDSAGPVEAYWDETVENIIPIKFDVTNPTFEPFPDEFQKMMPDIKIETGDNGIIFDYPPIASDDFIVLPVNCERDIAHPPDKDEFFFEVGKKVTVTCIATDQASREGKLEFSVEVVEKELQMEPVIHYILYDFQKYYDQDEIVVFIENKSKYVAWEAIVDDGVKSDCTGTEAGWYNLTKLNQTSCTPIRISDGVLGDTTTFYVTVKEPTNPLNRDDDHVPDLKDECPLRSEFPNGYEDYDGCPDDLENILEPIEAEDPDQPISEPEIQETEVPRFTVRNVKPHYPADNDQGGTANYNLKAEDNKGDVEVKCEPESRKFPIGEHEVTCLATNSAGFDEYTFTVFIKDDKKPTFSKDTLKSHIVRDFTLDGGNAWYPVVVATDNVDQDDVDVSCKYGRGELVPRGNYTNECRATDEAGNFVDDFFQIIVGNPPAFKNIDKIQKQYTTSLENFEEDFAEKVEVVGDTELKIECEPKSFPVGKPSYVDCIATDEYELFSRADFIIEVTKSGDSQDGVNVPQNSESSVVGNGQKNGNGGAGEGLTTPFERIENLVIIAGVIAAAAIGIYFKLLRKGSKKEEPIEEDLQLRDSSLDDLK